MDRRIENRRREVAEGRARSGLSKLLVVLIIASVGGLTAWLFRSPLLSVAEVVVAGASPHLRDQVRIDSGISLGQPLISVRPQEVEDRVAENPWVATATVSRRWPQRILIEITPRLPIAWLNQGEGWALVGADAVVLDTAPQAGTELPTLLAETEWAKLGGLAFLAELGPLQHGGAVVEEREGEIWAEIAGHQVRLGRPIEMEAKARALTALLGQGIEPGAIVSLVAPTRPAVMVSQSSASS